MSTGIFFPLVILVGYSICELPQLLSMLYAKLKSHLVTRTVKAYISCSYAGFQHAYLYATVLPGIIHTHTHTDFLQREMLSTGCHEPRSAESTLMNEPIIVRLY